MESHFRAFNRAATKLCLQFLKTALSGCVQTGSKWGNRGYAGQARDKSISDLSNDSVSGERREDSGDTKR